MKFLVLLKPSEHKVGNASHFINVERRLGQQVQFLRSGPARKIIDGGPWAVLNASAAYVAFTASVDSWEDLSHFLHEDPMSVYQAPEIHYLGDWEKAMAKHAGTVGSDSSVKSLSEDVRTDLGLDMGARR
jgi:hypothetical protein